MKGKVTFAPSGSGSTSARLTIPVAFVELLKLSSDERNVDLTFENDRLIITKAKDQVKK